MDSTLKIGQILVKQGTLSADALDHALLLQSSMTHKQPLASQLVAAGLITDTDALRGLSEQFGMPGIDLLQVAILCSHLEHVPHEIAVSRKLLPVLAREDRLFLAMANPKDRRAIDELEFVTGRKIFPYVAVRATLEKATTAAYTARERGESYYLAPRVPEQTLLQLGLNRTGAATTPRPEKPEEKKGAPALYAPSPAPSMGSRSMPAVDPRGANATVQTPPRNLATPLDQDTRETARPPQLEVLGEGYAAMLDRVAQPPSDTDDPIAADAADLDRPTAAGQHSLGPEAALTSPSGSAAPEATGKLVLIVDDEEGVRSILRRILKSMGHRVLEGRGGRDALHLLRAHSPDLVVMDAMLPELHGFDVARRMRKSQRYKTAPIIMMSGVYKGWRIAQDLRENYGIDDYVEKPFTVPDMTALLARRLTEPQPQPDGKGARNPDDVSAEAEALLVIGVEAYKAGDIERAIGALKSGIELDPASYRLRYQLALLYGKRGQVYDGIRELERAVELAPRHFPALKNLSILYEKAGFKTKAVEMWERCALVAPDADTQRSIKEHRLKLL